MSRRALLGLLCPVVAVALVYFAARRSKPKPVPITPGPDTTVVTGPLDAAGLIDYEAALNERLRGTITPDTNAVLLLLRCIGPKPEKAPLQPEFYRWLGVGPPPEQGQYLLRLHDQFADEVRDNATAFSGRESLLRYRPWTAADDPEFAAFVTANATPLTVAAEASRRPHYYHPVIARDRDGNRLSLANGLLPLPQRVRDVASTLALRTMLRCGEKKYDAAWEDVMTVHRLGRLMGRGGCVVERLVGVALDTGAGGSALSMLDAVKPTAAQALAWRDQLAALPPMPPMADGVDLAERFMFLDVAQFLRRGGPDVAKELFGVPFPDLPPAVLADALPRLDWDRVLRTANGRYDRLAAALRKPTHAERRAGTDAVVAECHPPDGDPTRADLGERVSRLYLPATAKMAEAEDRARVQFDIELTAFALAAYRADNGKYPAELAALVPRYAKTVPDDLYSGKPLIYKPTGAGEADGYLLYSVGKNGKDDGGLFYSDKPDECDIGHWMGNVFAPASGFRR